MGGPGSGRWPRQATRVCPSCGAQIDRPRAYCMECYREYRSAYRKAGRDSWYNKHRKSSQRLAGTTEEE